MRSSERKLGALAAATGLSAVAAATGLSAVAREVVHRVERAATSDTGERLVLRRRRQLREVVPLPCRSMHARLRPTHCASSSSWKRVEPSKFVGVKLADKKSTW